MRLDGDKIKQLRMAKGWSQEQLSEASGLNLRTIQRLEKGGVAALESGRALAAVFEVELSTLIVDAEQAAKPVSFREAIEHCFINYAEFYGTSRRSQYWWFFLFVLITVGVADLINVVLASVVTLLLALPLLAVGTRRLRDGGHSPWWQLLLIVPFGQVVVLILYALPTLEERP